MESDKILTDGKDLDDVCLIIDLDDVCPIIYGCQEPKTRKCMDDYYGCERFLRGNKN